MNKKGLIILIVFLSVVCVFMTGGFIYLLSSNFEWESFEFTIGEGKLIDSIEYENDASALGFVQPFLPQRPSVLRYTLS